MSDSNLHKLGEPPPSLVKALKRLLKPLIRLLLSHGITFPYLANLLKSIYVEVADKEFQLDDKKQSDSRISLLTGVHRKDTRRLREEDYSKYSMPENISIGAQLVASWISKTEYLDDAGNPLPLPKKLSSDDKLNGLTVDFESLVKSVSKQDLRPRVVLDEWLRLGVVHMDQQNHVVLNTQAFIPENNFEEKAYYFGQNLHDHIAAGTHNLLGQTPAFFDRSVYYNCLSKNSVKTLNDLSKQLGMEALKTLNSKAMQLQEHDSALEESNERINFGIYFYSTEEDDEPQDTLNSNDPKF